MAKTIMATLICVVLFGVIATINLINAECCGPFPVWYDTTEGQRKRADICYDGTKVDGYFCGHGKCNIFGCNCAGGCRRNGKGFNMNEAIRIFLQSYCTFRVHDNLHKCI